MPCLQIKGHPARATVERFQLEGRARGLGFDSHGRRISNATEVDDVQNPLPIYYEHNYTRQIGKGTLTRDHNGFTLSAELTLDPNNYFDSGVLTKINAGLVRCLSIGYQTSLEDHRYDAQPFDTHRVVKTSEVSISAQRGADPVAIITSLRRCG